MLGPKASGGDRERRETVSVCDGLEERLTLVSESAAERGIASGLAGTHARGPNLLEPGVAPLLLTAGERPIALRPASALDLRDDEPDPRRLRRGGVAVAVLAAAGTLLIADAVATVAWQEPVTAVLAHRQQNRLEGELTKVKATLPPPAAAPRERASPAQRVRRAAVAQRAELRKGKAVGKLRIPRLGDAWVFVQGTGESELKTGPGHYSTSSLPGLPGTTAVAGHRTTYGAPFRHIEKLRVGDRITAQMPYGTITYRVEGQRVVDPSNVKVLRDIGRPRLVLTACTPLYSAAQRLVVFARQVDARPRSAKRS